MGATPAKLLAQSVQTDIHMVLVQISQQRHIFVAVFRSLLGEEPVHHNIQRRNCLRIQVGGRHRVRQKTAPKGMIHDGTVGRRAEAADRRKTDGTALVGQRINILEDTRMAGVAKAGIGTGGKKLLLGAQTQAVQVLFHNHTVGVSVGIVTEQDAVGGIRQRIGAALVKVNGNGYAAMAFQKAQICGNSICQGIQGNTFFARNSYLYALRFKKS